MGFATEAQSTLKIECYAGLMAMVLDGRRHTVPRFRADICTTLGEFGPGMWELIVELARMYAANIVREGPRLDGFKINQLTAKFRSDLKSSLQVAVAKGMARMLLEAGLV